MCGSYRLLVHEQDDPLNVPLLLSVNGLTVTRQMMARSRRSVSAGRYSRFRKFCSRLAIEEDDAAAASAVHRPGSAIIEFSNEGSLPPASSAAPVIDESVLALLVDRDQDTRQMYAEFLKLGHWRVDEASDGREALAKALALRPDVIITETRLPGMDGITLCGLLRRDVATNAIPVVFVTGDAYAVDVDRATAAGADLVLTKPCLPEELLVRVRALLEHNTEVHARASRVRANARQHLARADEGLNRAVDSALRRSTLKKAHQRGDTTTPPVPPPSLVCPSCDRPLAYRRSHIGGVSSKHAEQWDYFECENGCGTFQYRARTRKLRKVS